MKATPSFKEVISNKLDEMAQADKLFAESLKKEGKNIDDCITYILNQVQQSGCNGFADDEIFGMAAHYYDENDIKVGKPVKANVVVNHKSDKPKAKAKTKKPEPVEANTNQLSLF